MIRDCREVAKGLAHKQPDQAQLILAAGRRGYGKTTFLNAYTRIREPRALFLDPFGDFAGVKWSRDYWDALGDMAAGDPCRRRVAAPIDSDSKDWAEEFFEACIGLLRDSLLVLDEITLWSDANPRGPLQTLVLQGRRLGIRMVVASQRIAVVPGIILSEATDLVLFRMTRPRDLDVAEDWIDSDSARETLRSLDVGECIHVEQ